LKHVLDHVRLKAEETVEAELFTQYGTDPDQMVSALQREAMVALKVAQYYEEMRKLQDQLSGADQQQPDPVVELKKQELAQRAQRDEAQAQIDQARIQLDAQREQNDVQHDQAKLALQQAIADQRAELSMRQMESRRGNFPQ